MKKIEEKLKLLPDCPGVYLMRNSSGQIIYAGKASSLRKRVPSHFNFSDSAAPKVRAMAENIDDFEYIAADTEVEALILECSLIKKHRPKYNVRFMDDKKYPYISISGGDYPSVHFTRASGGAGFKYYGPYTDASAARKAVKVLRKIFLLRTCRGNLKQKARPCLYYHLSECSGPCCGHISKKGYNKAVEGARLFLSGRCAELIREFKKEMAVASANSDFEKAAFFRDRLKALESVSEKQNMEFAGGENADYLSYAKEGNLIMAGVLAVRGGKVVRFEHFPMQARNKPEGAEILSTFVKLRYIVPADAPPLLVLPEFPDDMLLIKEWLRGLRRGPFEIIIPSRGRRRDLMKKLDRNLNMKLREAGALERKSRRDAAIRELAGIAAAKGPFEVIECFDAAYISGSSAVGAVAVFENGFPLRRAYRTFKIKAAAGADDALMIEELVRRRYIRSVREKRRLPGLIVVDGGRNQVAAARRGLAASGFSCPVVGFAKRSELLYLFNRRPRPAGNSYVLDFLRHLSDEAHKAATSYHVYRRGAGFASSLLDGAAGIGRKKKALLLREFGDIRKIAEASEEDLQKTKGIGPELARGIKLALKDV